MSISRRDFLKLSSLVAASTALSACRPLFTLVEGRQAVDWTDPDGFGFLAMNRLTFGARLEELARVAEIGLPAWVEEQLAPESIDDLGCTLRIRNLDTLGMDSQQLFDTSNKLFDDFDRQTIPIQLRQGTLIRQVYSRRQLFEVMVEFWNDHFNISTDKGECYYLKTVDDRQVSRLHALGNFHDLLASSAHSPAMLIYLDNQSNWKGAPNENYARELLELHSLGVNGGYTQADVMELARCLTGWSVKDHFWRGEFTFDPELHDYGGKSVLGMLIRPAGQAEAEQVTEYVSSHPSTALFIVKKLARRFLGDAPPADIVLKAARAFHNSSGDIRSTLRVVLLDGLPLAASKYRRPVNFVAAALRMLDVESDCGPAVQDYLLRMGQLPFNWPTPDGYPDRGEAWQGNLMPRWQFAFALVRNEIQKTELDLPSLLSKAGGNDLPASLDTLAGILLGSPLPKRLRDRLLAVLRTEGAEEDEMISILAGGILASPAFQWR